MVWGVTVLYNYEDYGGICKQNRELIRRGRPKIAPRKAGLVDVTGSEAWVAQSPKVVEKETRLAVVSCAGRLALWRWLAR